MRPVFIAFALVIASCVGCQSPSAKTGQAKTATKYVDVPVPPGIDARQLEPRTGPSREFADQPLETILGRMEPPHYLQDLSSGNDQNDGKRTATSTSTEPALSAQRFYVAGRREWLRDNNYQAITNLESAHRIEPNRPEIVRLLGTIHSQLNPVRATQFLKKAVRLDSTHVESLFLLARHAIGQHRWAEAIWTLGHAISFEGSTHRVDTAIWSLAHYFLAFALDHAGYDQACIESYEHSLDAPELFAGSSRYGRQLLLLHRHRGSTWQRIGDAYHRLSLPARALEAYQRATESAGLRDVLISRLAYTYLRLGQVEMAQQLVVRRLQYTGGGSASIEMVKYLAEQGSNPQDLADELRHVYEESDRSSDLVMAITPLLEGEARVQLLRDHLTHKPADGAVFAALLRELIQTKPRDAVTDGLEEAIKTTAATISRLPPSADLYTNTLLDVASNPQTLLETLDRTQVDPKDDPLIQFLRGKVLIHLGRKQEAESSLVQVLDTRPDMQAARLMLVSLLAEMGQAERAKHTLQPVADQDDPKVIGLRAMLMAQTGKLDEAIRLLERAMVKHVTNIKLAIHKSRLQIAQNDIIGAERTLLIKLDAYPKSEPLYDELFRLYESGLLGEQQMEKLTLRLHQSIPHSWLARLKSVEALIENNDPTRVSQAEQAVKRLMNERPNDHRALGRYLRLLRQSNRVDEANGLIDRKLDNEPTNAQLLQVALRYYRQLPGQVRRFHKVAVLWLLTMPTSEDRDLELATLYIRIDQPSKAVEILRPRFEGQPQNPIFLVRAMRRALSELEQFGQAKQLINEAIERFTNHRADLMLELAVFHEDLAEPEIAERVMLKIVEQYPDHPSANNALAYTWAERGVNLPQAEKMILKALRADPASAAIRDSLGWVYYKQGRFADAERELRNATDEKNGNDPVILDHWGDALYRLDRPTDAAQAWQRASSHYDAYETQFNREWRGLDVRLRQKIDAIKHNERPDIADTPGPRDPSRTKSQRINQRVAPYL